MQMQYHTGEQTEDETRLKFKLKTDKISLFELQIYSFLHL